VEIVHLSFSLLVCFFTACVCDISAETSVKRLCITSSIKDREPVDKLKLHALKNRQFFVFVEMQNCLEDSVFSFQITTVAGILRQSFKVPKSLRYRTSHAFKTESDVRSIEILDAYGHKMGLSLKAISNKKCSTKSSSKSKSKKRKIYKTMGVKKLLQSMQG
jgi:hypothetical protein